jgi:hypothetical protein
MKNKGFLDKSIPILTTFQFEKPEKRSDSLNSVKIKGKSWDNT